MNACKDTNTADLSLSPALTHTPLDFGRKKFWVRYMIFAAERSRYSLDSERQHGSARPSCEYKYLETANVKGVCRGKQKSDLVCMSKSFE